MKFLLVGGGGNLGRGFADSLDKDDVFEIWDNDRNLFELNLDVLHGLKVDLIINLSVIANFSDQGVDPFTEYYKTNVDGIIHLINLARIASTPLIQISTREVIGVGNPNNSLNLNTPKNDLVTKTAEFEPCFPLHAYGKTKLMAEYLTQSYEKSSIVRLNTCYTNDVLSNKGLIAILYNKVIRNDSIELTNDGLALRDPMHVMDLVSLIKQIFIKEAYKQTFHAGGGFDNILSLREICLTFNDKVKIVSGSTNTDHGFLMDIAKAEKFLGWTPEVNFKKWAQKLKTQTLKSSSLVN